MTFIEAHDVINTVEKGCASKGTVSGMSLGSIFIVVCFTLATATSK